MPVTDENDTSFKPPLIKQEKKAEKLRAILLQGNQCDKPWILNRKDIFPALKIIQIDPFMMTSEQAKNREENTNSPSESSSSGISSSDSGIASDGEQLWCVIEVIEKVWWPNYSCCMLVIPVRKENFFPEFVARSSLSSQWSNVVKFLF